MDIYVKFWPVLTWPLTKYANVTWLKQKISKLLNFSQILHWSFGKVTKFGKIGQEKKLQAKKKTNVGVEAPQCL